MKKIIIFIVVALLAYPLVSSALTARPLGGKIIFTELCDEGMLLKVKTAKGVVPYMWIVGNLPYLSKRTPYVGQNILGMARTAAMPCTISGVPYDGGVPIQYHGSSY